MGLIYMNPKPFRSYIIHFDIILLVMLRTFTILAIIFIIIYYERFIDFYYLALGTIVYGRIIVFGIGVQKADQSTIIYLSLPLLFAIVLGVFSVRKKSSIVK